MQIYNCCTGKQYAQPVLCLIKKENVIMNNITTAAAAVVLSALSFGVFAAGPVTTASQNNADNTTIEAGSNMVRGSHVTEGTNDTAFNAHTLVAGEWE